MFCQHCGAQMSAEQRFCTACGGTQGGGSPLGATPPPSPAPFIPPVGVRARTGDWIGAGWELVKGDLGTFVLVAFLFLLLNSCVPMVLQGALSVGVFIYCVKRILNRRTDVGDLMKGFNYFVPALVASLIIAVFVCMGFVFCIIPGLVLQAMYQFTYLFIVDKRMDFWPAMQASHAVVKNDYVGFTLFTIVLALINLVGILCCVVGVLVTLPISFAAIAVAYKELVGFEPAMENV